MNFYKHFIGDYARDTGHLTITEHGAFRLMLDHFYGTSRPLPSERKALYRLVRAETKCEQKAVDDIAQQFWRRMPADPDVMYEWLALKNKEERQALFTIASEWDQADGLINIRALIEIVKARLIAEKNRATAIAREENKRRLYVVGGQK